MIGLTETWLHPGVNDAEITIHGFTLFRGDRATEKNIFPHGGVALYVKDTFSLDDIKCHSDGKCDFLCGTLTPLDINIIIVY